MAVKQTKAWSARQRLEFIEQQLYWVGRVNRADLIRRFYISVPQAALDFRAYQALAPRNMTYDFHRKAYVRTAAFRPALIRPDAEAMLAELKKVAEIQHSPSSQFAVPAETVPSIQRPVEPSVLRAVMAAVTTPSSLVVRYAAREDDEPRKRRLTPHAFVFDGQRWHVRAWDHEEKEFGDFVVGRIFDAGHPGAPGLGRQSDTDWNTKLEIVLVPNQSLSRPKRRQVEREFEMTGGEIRITVRAALAFYFVTGNPDIAPVLESADGWERKLVVANAEEVRVAALRSRSQVLAAVGGSCTPPRRR